MKFTMNGSLILGTLDGANVEIREEIGAENIFTFGLEASQVPEMREKAKRGDVEKSARFARALELVESGAFGSPDIFAPIVSALGAGGDFFMVGADFDAYLKAQAEVDAAFVDRARWMRMSINASCRSGKFSSDRTVREYAEQIWRIERMTPIHEKRTSKK